MTTRHPRPVSRPYRYPVLIAAAVSAVFAFAHLGTPALEDWDEGLHAKIVLDLMNSGQRLVYAVDGTIDASITKPPLLFYGMLLAMTALGPTEFAVRIIPAASFCALAIAVAMFCTRHLNARIAIGAVLVLCGNKHLIFDHFARQGAMDAPLALALSLTMFGLWHGRTTPLPSYAYPAYAGALLLKGVAALQIAPVVCIWAVLRRDLAVVFRYARLLAVATVPVAVWVACREFAAPGFVHNMLTVDVLGRTFEVVGASPYDPMFYLHRIAKDFAPALVAGPVVLVLLWWRQRHSGGSGWGQHRDLALWLVLWVALPIALFSFARTQHDWYALPSYVPLTILSAWLMDTGLIYAISWRPRWLSRAAATGTLATILTIALLQRNTGRLLTTPARAAALRQEIGSILGRAAHCSGALSIYRAYHAPALLFYLTRAEVPYRRIDDHAFPGTLDQRDDCHMILTSRREAEALRRWLPESWNATTGNRYVVFERRHPL